VVSAAQNHRLSLRNPPKTAAEYLATLERQGLTQTVSALREYVLRDSTVRATTDRLLVLHNYLLFPGTPQMIHNREVLLAEMRAVASFGDDPAKVEVILPPGDPQVMLAEVATKPNFQLFGTAFSYSYPDDELAKRPAQPANTLIEMGVPYCFHVPDNAMIEMKDAGEISHLVFKKVWTGRAEGSSDADYRSPTHVLYHNNTSIKTPNFIGDPVFLDTRLAN